LNNQIKSKQNIPLVTKTVCSDENTFPKLTMKEGKTQPSLVKPVVIKKEIKEKNIDKTQELQTTFKAGTFRLLDESDIYNSVNGDVLFTWEKGKSFTSGVMTQNWVKITGYFVDKKWTSATQALWIKKVNTKKR